jgi:hypothetical protein
VILLFVLLAILVLGGAYDQWRELSIANLGAGDDANAIETVSQLGVSLSPLAVAPHLC